MILGDVSAGPEALEPSPIGDIDTAAGTKESEWTTRHLWILEANIDDMTGEVAGYLTEKLRDEGCLDAWVTPIFMKKNRPAFMVHVLCKPQDQDRFMRLLFVESTTLGVRRRSVERCALHRQTVTASTAVGDVMVKVSHAPHTRINCDLNCRVRSPVVPLKYGFSQCVLCASPSRFVSRVLGLRAATEVFAIILRISIERIPGIYCMGLSWEPRR